MLPNVPVLAVPTPEEGNHLFPLPPDYEDLTSEGQRLARVNASRQHLLPYDLSTLELHCRRYVAAVWFFDEYYLTNEVDDDGNVTFNPLFYRAKLPTPDFHWAWRRYIATDRSFAGVGPRGSAKTFFHALNVIHFMVSCPLFGVTYATSTDELAQEMGDRTKFQCYENPRINNDWSKEYGVKQMKPRRSEGKQGMSSFKLANRSEFFSTSAQSRQRGLRPIKYILDDPEWDPSNPEGVNKLADGIEELIFKIALPMVMQAGTSLIWTGTFVSLRHYLWQAMVDEQVVRSDGKPVMVARDPRFRKWIRHVAPVETTKEDGTRVSIWPHMWPADDDEKSRLLLPDSTKTLKDIEDEIGTDRYNSEYRCRPGRSKGSYFPPLEKTKHGYSLAHMDDLFATEPARSSAILNFTKYTGAFHEGGILTIQELFSTCPRFILADPTWSQSIHSDYRTSMCIALTPWNDIFILDLWARQCSEDEQIDVMFQMGQRWKASCFGIEHIASGKTLTSRLESICANRSLDTKGIMHWPAVRPFNPGHTDKSIKISRIKWRFDQCRVKLPWWKLDEWPWKALCAQIANFDPSLKDGGLEKDDLLDTLSFSQYVIGGRPHESTKSLPHPTTAVEKFLAGERDDGSGIPLGYTALLTATPEDVGKMLAAHHQQHSPTKVLSI